MSRIRLPERILETARAAGTEADRSPDAQVDRWVRIGRAIERSGLSAHLEISEARARDDRETPGGPSP